VKAEAKNKADRMSITHGTVQPWSSAVSESAEMNNNSKHETMSQD